MIHLSEKQTKYMWDAYDVIIKRRRNIKGVFDTERQSSIVAVIDAKFHENDTVNGGYKLQVITSILIPTTIMFFLSNDNKNIKYKDLIENLATFIEERTTHTN